MVRYSHSLQPAHFHGSRGCGSQAIEWRSTSPLAVRSSRGFRDSVSIERGPPLSFSYGIEENWLKLRDRGMTADWQVYPGTQWNYALSLRPDAYSVGIETSESEMQDRPFSARHSPVKLRAHARKLPNWWAEDGVANSVPQSPVSSSEPEETITLIPYASAKLRITAFPQLKFKH